MFMMTATSYESKAAWQKSKYFPTVNIEDTPRAEETNMMAYRLICLITIKMRPSLKNYGQTADKIYDQRCYKQNISYKSSL